VILLDYIIQVQDYPPLFSKLHDAFLGRDALFQMMTYHSMITKIFGVSSSSHLFGYGS